MHEDKEDKQDNQPLVEDKKKKPSKAEKQAKRAAKSAEKEAKAFAASQKKIDSDLKLSSYSAAQQAKHEAALRKEAGDPGLGEKALMALTGGIAGAITGGWSRMGKADRAVAAFRDEVKFRRALMGAKTERAVSGMSTTDQKNVHTVLSELGSLKNEGWISKNGMVRRLDAPNQLVPWWVGDKEPTTKEIRSHIKKATKGNEMSIQWIGGIAETLKTHRANSKWFRESNEWDRQTYQSHKNIMERSRVAFEMSNRANLSKEVRDHYRTIYSKYREEYWKRIEAHRKEMLARKAAAAKAADDVTKAHSAKLSEYYRGVGARHTDHNGNFSIPKGSESIFLDENGKPTMAFLDASIGANDYYNTHIGIGGKKQIADNQGEAKGLWRTLHDEFGQNVNVNSWFDGMDAVGRYTVTSADWLKNARSFTESVSKYRDLHGRPPSAEGNPLADVLAAQRSLGILQRRARAMEEGPKKKEIYDAIGELQGRKRDAENRVREMRLKMARKNSEYEKAAENAKELETYRVKSMSDDHIANLETFKKLVMPDGDEGGGLFEAMFFEEVADGQLKGTNKVKDMFLPWTRVFHQGVPLAVDVARLRPELVTGLSAARSTIYTPQVAILDENDLAKSIDVMKRNPNFITPQMRREMNRVRAQFRERGAKLDFKPELFDKSVDAVMSDKEQLNMLGVELGRRANGEDAAGKRGGAWNLRDKMIDAEGQPDGPEKDAKRRSLILEALMFLQIHAEPVANDVEAGGVEGKD